MIMIDSFKNYCSVEDWYRGEKNKCLTPQNIFKWSPPHLFSKSDLLVLTVGQQLILKCL